MRDEEDFALLLMKYAENIIKSTAMGRIRTIVSFRLLLNSLIIFLKICWASGFIKYYFRFKSDTFYRISTRILVMLLNILNIYIKLRFSTQIAIFCIRHEFFCTQHFFRCYNYYNLFFSSNSRPPSSQPIFIRCFCAKEK